MLHRMTRVISGFARLIAFAALSLAAGWALGSIVGDFFSRAPVMGGRVGLAVSGFLLLGSYPDALEQSGGAGAFILWWIRGTLAALLAVACAISIYFIQVALSPRLHLGWDPLLIRLASGALALLVWLHVSAWAIATILGEASLPALLPRVLTGGLTSLRDQSARARNLGAKRPRRP